MRYKFKRSKYIQEPFVIGEVDYRERFNLLTTELNPSAQRCLQRYFLLGILIFKGLTTQRLYKSFGIKGLKEKTVSTR
jgi:hypothetical protein